VEALDVPRKYVLKALQRLADAGVLHSRRGPGGGYALARPAGQVTLLDVVRAIDPDFLAAPAERGGRADPSLVRLGAEVAESAAAVLARWTLADCLAAEGRPTTKRGK
jgi:Rrf2 family protein